MSVIAGWLVGQMAVWLFLLCVEPLRFMVCAYDRMAAMKTCFFIFMCSDTMVLPVCAW